MLKTNALQFSVVREDPEIEIELFRSHHVQAPVLIGSGGCTALALSSAFPGMPLHLIEPNPAQVKLIREKVRALRRLTRSSLSKKFGVQADSTSLIEKGNFESLFKGFREFIGEFVVGPRDLLRLVKNGTASEWRHVFQHRYWPVAFDLYFCNSLLLTMFGPAAIQHAPPESYSQYFRNVLEGGLVRPDRATNYFLHHIMLGHYLADKRAWPYHLQIPPKQFNISFFEGFAHELPSYEKFDFVGLSNIFDWSSASEVQAIAERLADELKPGAIIVYRQLNNTKNFEQLFGQNFKWLKPQAQKLLKRDRSLFYSSLHIGRKMP